MVTKMDPSVGSPYITPSVTHSQFISNRLLLLLLLTIVFPIYGLYSNQTTLVTYSLIIGAILWMWKWRWWWEPIRNFVSRRSQ